METSMGRASGLSGDKILYEGDQVVKYSDRPDRWNFLNGQATYMADCGFPFVEVLGIAHGRYWMKRYPPASLKADNPRHILRASLIKAKCSLEPLWDTDEPRFVPYEWRTAHLARVRELFAINDLSGDLQHWFLNAFEQVADMAHRLTVCAAIHGDATLDNTVVDPDVGGFRWIDPIPPSNIIPAFKAVDLGKLLQSSHGWEFFLAGSQDLPKPCDDVVLEGENLVDQQAAQYFHALCYLRILRYATMARNQSIYDYAINKLHELL